MWQRHSERKGAQPGTGFLKLFRGKRRGKSKLSIRSGGSSLVGNLQKKRGGRKSKCYSSESVSLWRGTHLKLSSTFFALGGRYLATLSGPIGGGYGSVEKKEFGKARISSLGKRALGNLLGA